MASGDSTAAIADRNGKTQRLVRAVVTGGRRSEDIRRSIVEAVNRGVVEVCALVGAEACRKLTEADIWDDGDVG